MALKRWCTFPNLVACLCLFVVLGGDAVAKDAVSHASRLITGKQVKNRSLTAADVKRGSLTGKEVKDRSIGTADLAPNAVTGAQVKDGSLSASDFSGSVAGPKGDKGDRGEAGPVGQIQGAAAGGDLAGTYPAPSIAAGAVSSSKLADGAVTGAKLGAAAVGSEHLKLPLALSSDEESTPLAVTNAATGSDPVLAARATAAQGVKPALYGEVGSIFANFGTAAVYGRNTGTGGLAGLFYTSNAANSRPAVLVQNDGSGEAIVANAGGTGDGIDASIDGSGSAVFGWVPNFSTGRAGRFVNFNASHTLAPLLVETRSNGNIAEFRSGTPSATRARIDGTGKGFFNGGTQSSGADLAEVVPICGARPERGQVLEIDPQRPDCFRLARSAGSSRVAGVVSTAPGVTLGAEEDAEAGPALALAGRVPVRVTGKVRIGDLLVASGTPGRAQRAGADPAVGSVIGKALGTSDGAAGTVTMLVMAR